MKKVLFASTALVMTAGVAAADVKLTGEAGMGLLHSGGDTVLHNNIEFYLSGTVSTDSGVTVGASADLGGASYVDGVSSDGDLNDAEVYISSGGLKLTTGNIGEATDAGLSDIGYDGIGTDNVAEIGGIGSHDVRVDYSFGDFTAVASLDSGDSDNFQVGVKGSFDAFSFNVAFGEESGDDVVNVLVGYDAGAFSIDALYRETGSGEGMGVIGSYTTGDITVSAAFSENDTDDAWGLGIAYDLGGATLAAGYGEVSGDTVADLGVSFSF